jgi:serine/threonine protein kinase, bacterial
MRQIAAFIMILAIGLFSCGKSNNPADPNPGSTITITTISPTEGPYGTVVTITGKGFGTSTTDNTVLIHGVQAVIINAINTTLHVKVPKGAGSGAVTVKVNGQSANGPLFTYDLSYTVSTFASLEQIL